MIPLSNYLLKSNVSVKQYLWYVNCEIDMWYSYVHFGLLNEINNHTRKYQRYCQRKFCSWLSRRDRIKSKHSELFI